MKRIRILLSEKKFKAEVEKNQEARVQHLNQSIDNLINAYTQGITKRIDEPGYVLKVNYRDWETDRKSTRLNSSHSAKSRMPSSA